MSTFILKRKTFGGTAAQIQGASILGNATGANMENFNLASKEYLKSKKDMISAWKGSGKSASEFFKEGGAGHTMLENARAGRDLVKSEVSTIGKAGGMDLTKTANTNFLKNVKAQGAAGKIGMGKAGLIGAGLLAGGMLLGHSLSGNKDQQQQQNNQQQV